LRHYLSLGFPLPGQGDHLVSEALYIRDPDGHGIEVYRDFRRTEGDPVTAARIIAAVEAFPDIENVVTVAYDQVSGGAPAFERNHDETGLPWDPLKPAAMVSACMDFTEMLLAGNLAVRRPAHRCTDRHRRQAPGRAGRRLPLQPSGQ